jgi:uncharacterized spore protein YtfJ
VPCSLKTRNRRANAIVSVRDVVAFALSAAKCVRVPVVAVEFGFAGIASSAKCNVAKMADAVLQGEREGRRCEHGAFGDGQVALESIGQLFDEVLVEFLSAGALVRSVGVGGR